MELFVVPLGTRLNEHYLVKERGVHRDRVSVHPIELDGYKGDGWKPSHPERALANGFTVLAWAFMCLY